MGKTTLRGLLGKKKEKKEREDKRASEDLIDCSTASPKIIIIIIVGNLQMHLSPFLASSRACFVCWEYLVILLAQASDSTEFDYVVFALQTSRVRGMIF